MHREKMVIGMMVKWPMRTVSVNEEELKGS